MFKPNITLLTCLIHLYVWRYGVCYSPDVRMLWETFVFRLVLCKVCVGVKATAIQTLTPRAPCRELYLGGKRAKR